MCGIAGMVSPNRSADQLNSLGKTMMSALYHRGPDAGGLWISDTDGLVLSHRRLAIQDLSESGAQPMFSRSDRYCIVFNGEIYNFLKIAEDLDKRGHQFIGHSDTEVLLAAIEEWGLNKAIQQFVGMFAFALWDKQEKVLHLCRDRLGEKPCYYGWIKGEFYFSSELKAIERVVSSNDLTIDSFALTKYLRYGYIEAPYSIYQGLYKLFPGTILSLPHTAISQSVNHSPWPGGSNISPQSYWSILDVANKGLSEPIVNENEAVEQLDSLLHQVVRRQMIADVKVGLFLSGGIDSTVISAIAQREAGEKIRTFTIGYAEGKYDESKHAEKIACHLDTEHLTVHVSPQDALQVVPDLPSIYDEPFADSSQIPAYLVSKMAKQHVTVCLSGDGGDELFGGYNRYLWTDRIWKRTGKIPLPIRKLFGKALALPSPATWDMLYRVINYSRENSQDMERLVGLKLQKLAGFMQQTDVEHCYEYLLSYWDKPEELIITPPAESATFSKLKYPDTTDFISRAMYLDQVGYLQGDNLTKVDLASMAVSLETRLPLLSHDIVELSWRIPLSMKVKNKTTKSVLREVLYKYVPRELVDRPKMGFSVPVAEWLRGELREWAESLLSPSSLAKSSFLRTATVRRAWNEHQMGVRDHSHRLWTILMFLAWQAERR